MLRNQILHRPGGPCSWSDCASESRLSSTSQRGQVVGVSHMLIALCRTRQCRKLRSRHLHQRYRRRVHFAKYLTFRFNQCTLASIVVHLKLFSKALQREDSTSSRRNVIPLHQHRVDLAVDCGLDRNHIRFLGNDPFANDRTTGIRCSGVRCFGCVEVDEG